jgi:hypothetical protein
VYSDYKTFGGGAYFRCADGAFAGSSITWMIVGTTSGHVGLGGASDATSQLNINFSTSSNLPVKFTRGGNWSYLYFDGTSTGIGDAGGSPRLYMDGAHAAKIVINSGLEITGNNGNPYFLLLDADSAAKPSTNTWIITSDIRTKRNVQRFEGDMNVIRALDPIVAEYNGLGQTPEGARVVSFDAEKLRALVPQAVSSVRGKLNPEDAEATDLLGVNTHEIFFHMLRAIQQLDARLTALEKN